ncbi:unnamed protein product [Prorocentrum cordatum]|uniref:Uncharacterized protein n=1 Tax=Prorocentrum cordatum TaxID=2364126 RepID=A0ABN9X9G8_9DINO|nr:unnamed protein product [Polarella glacialis]
MRGGLLRGALRRGEDRNRKETKAVLEAVDRARPVAELSEIKELCATLYASDRAKPGAELSELRELYATLSDVTAFGNGQNAADVSVEQQAAARAAQEQTQQALLHLQENQRHLTEEVRTGLGRVSREVQTLRIDLSPGVIVSPVLEYPGTPAARRPRRPTTAAGSPAATPASRAGRPRRPTPWRPTAPWCSRSCRNSGAETNYTAGANLAGILRAIEATKTQIDFTAVLQEVHNAKRDVTLTVEKSELNVIEELRSLRRTCGSSSGPTRGS